MYVTVSKRWKHHSMLPEQDAVFLTRKSMHRLPGSFWKLSMEIGIHQIHNFCLKSLLILKNKKSISVACTNIARLNHVCIWMILQMQSKNNPAHNVTQLMLMSLLQQLQSNNHGETGEGFNVDKGVTFKVSISSVLFMSREVCVNLRMVPLKDGFMVMMEPRDQSRRGLILLSTDLRNNI